MYNEDSFDETVNSAFDLYRELKAEDERKFREALGENESDNFSDQDSEAGADPSGGAVTGTPESWCNMTGGKAVNVDFSGDETVPELNDPENAIYSEPDYLEERETVEAENALTPEPEAWAKAAVDVPTDPNPSDSKAMDGQAENFVSGQSARCQRFQGKDSFQGCKAGKAEGTAPL